MTETRSTHVAAILRRRIAMLIAIGIFTAAITALGLTTLPPQYRASAQILFPGASPQDINTHKHSLISLFSQSQGANGLKINAPNRSNILTLHLTRASPTQASRNLNALIKTYVTQRINAQTLTDPNARAFIRKLERNIQTARQKLITFENRALNANPAQAQYDAAKLKLLDIQNKMQIFLTRDTSLTLNRAAPILQESETLQNLLERQSRLKQRHDTLSRSNNDQQQLHAIASSLTTIDQEITAESEKILQNLKIQYAQTKAQIKQLEAERAISPTQIKIAQLKTRIKEGEDLLESFNQIQDLQKTSNPQTPQILKSAAPATKPIFPNIPVLTAAAALIAMLFTALIAIIADKTQRTFTSARQIEETLNYSCYGLIPRAKPNPNKPIADFVLDNPANATAQGVRALNLNLKLHQDIKQEGCKIITLTSSLPAEGKTTLACWIARLAAKSGQKTIIIDADLRRPSLHTALGLDNKNTLADILSGAKPLEKALNTSDKSGLHALTSRTSPAAALDLITSDKMDKLLKTLRGKYDLIIIDSPAALAVPDVCALQKNTDLFLHCIAWNKTPRRFIHKTIKQLNKFANPQIATVLTQIDPKKHIQLGYGHTETAYGDYKET